MVFNIGPNGKVMFDKTKCAVYIATFSFLFPLSQSHRRLSVLAYSADYYISGCCVPSSRSKIIKRRLERRPEKGQRVDLEQQFGAKCLEDLFWTKVYEAFSVAQWLSVLLRVSF